MGEGSGDWNVLLHGTVSQDSVIADGEGIHTLRMVSRWFIHGDGAVNGDNVAIGRDGRAAVVAVPSLRQWILECMSLRSCGIWQMRGEDVCLRSFFLCGG